MPQQEQLNGGIKFRQGTEEGWYFGWANPYDDCGEAHKTSPIHKQNHEEIKAEMPDFKIKGQYKEKEKVFLWDAAKQVTGKHLPCYHQSVGSCVGQGKSKAEHYIMCCEILRGELERVIMPYEPYGYAQSRVCAGISGGGDGSTGGGAAEAARLYGVLRSDSEGLPKWRESGQTVYWPGDTDRSWGRSGAPSKYVDIGKRNLIKTTAPMRSYTDVAEAIQNHFAVTIASNWGGMMSPPLVGNPAVRLNKRVTTWSHQMMVCGWWNHPELGELFYVQNSWAEDAHGQPASDEPPGGFWVKKEDIERIVREGDSYAYSQFDGFPADMIPWVF